AIPPPSLSIAPDICLPILQVLLPSPADDEPVGWPCCSTLYMSVIALHMLLLLHQESALPAPRTTDVCTYLSDTLPPSHSILPTLDGTLPPTTISLLHISPSAHLPSSSVPSHNIRLSPLLAPLPTLLHCIPN